MRKKEGPNPSCILEGCQYESLKSERDLLKLQWEEEYRCCVSKGKDRDLWKSKAEKLAEVLRLAQEDLHKEFCAMDDYEVCKRAKALLEEFGEGK